MKLGNKGHGRVRTTILIGTCLTVGAIGGPGIAGAAEKLAQNVFVTNTASNPIPVAPQGTTQIAGTVTVANQPAPPPAPAAPIPIQIRIKSSPVTRDAPTSTETLFTVPQGKVLTIEYAEFYFSQPADAYNANLQISCGIQQTENIEEVSYHLPQVEGANLTRIFAGPIKMLIPPGRCVQSHVTIINTDIPENGTYYVNGGITGYLSDLPAS